ncbi:hypothetical protein FRB94_014653 [Tulasnella sp. JGI-2019a]|nr:hypothetical protein FRB93_002458 [Tulasnella sp. JGI-2019a]KAG9007085.1 hypothetical protein FRB94_014653 [Tulasnella sp. JGI-2019a]KAG9033191.1 hypothetical protein FRB95_000446 [Tulasnella sp. JGI-2019a]
MFLKPQQSKSKDAQKHTQDPALQPWVEKYRPKTIEDVSSQEHTVNVLRKTLTSTNLPHMLFYGPPGTGKTSTILALARQLFGPENFRNRVLELNASDERGISIVREKIKNFARQTPRATGPDSQYPCPPYKIIILDEADSMTQDAQGALRRIMETYARITRFCLVCNYVTRIIEPLASRCSKFRFKPLDVSSTRARIEYIATEEKIVVNPEVITTLIGVSEGDLRRAITYLQSAYRLSSSTTPPTPITSIDIQEIAGVVPDIVVRNFAASLGIEFDSAPEDSMILDEKDETAAIRAVLRIPKKATGFDGVKAQVKSVMRRGYSVAQLLNQLHDVIVMHPNMTARQQAASGLILGEADKALIDGGDEELQLLDVALRIHQTVKKD